MAVEVIVPESIVVHLGRPEDSATNVTVTFPDYVKNVTSGEIYPTWNESALRANILAIISFALNRIFLKFYRSQGYDFDITNSTSIDQSFSQSRNVFQNISDIVDEIFNDYIRVEGRIEPLSARFCNGTTTTCEGLSQWGTVDLAEQGYGTLDILKYYYGDNIEIVYNAPVSNFADFLSGRPVRLGDSGRDVYDVQVLLNRISDNYPAIPKIYPTDGVFDEEMEEAVKKFQTIFKLNPDGIVGKQTGYKLIFLFVGIKRLTELQSEGLILNEFPKYAPPENAVMQMSNSLYYMEGDSGESVRLIQFWLGYVSAFYQTVPFVSASGVYDSQTVNAVLAFQRQFNLPQTGVVDNATWHELYNAYSGILADVRADFETTLAEELKIPMRLGDMGQNVKELQKILNLLKRTYPEIPSVLETGTFGQRTKMGVIVLQKEAGLEPTGVVDQKTLNFILNEEETFNTSRNPQALQYPGYILKEGMSDLELMRNGHTLSTPIYHLHDGLREISFQNESVPLVTPQFHFISDTKNAVIATQKLAGLPETGEVNFKTMEYIRDNGRREEN